MDSTNRRRCKSFEEEDSDVQFLTPHYDGSGPEPLDLTKMKLEDDQDDEESSDDDEERQNELLMSRGRSRSRSVHANDDNNGNYLPEGVEQTAKALKLEKLQERLAEATNKRLGGERPSTGSANADRTGPLQHREVVALQKGLEEATQSLNKVNNPREDEEERMAADAEKRKRALAASNNLPTGTSEPARRVKLLLLGDSGVGKSSLINRWTLDAFTPSLTSTVGVNFKSKKINYQGELMQVQVWDTAGQEQFHKITTSYYKGAQGIMLVYDVSDQKSLDNVGYWIKNIKTNASDSVQVVLIGNKIDLRVENGPNCVDPDKGKEIAKKYSVPFFETSAKDSSHVDDAFLTLVGQIVEMSTPKHPLTVKASLQGMDRKSIDIRASNMPNTPSSNSPPNHHLSNVGNNAKEANGANSGSKDLFKSLGLKKTNSSNPISPDRGGNGSNNPSASNTAGSTAAGQGEDKEKCIIS